MTIFHSAGRTSRSPERVLGSFFLTCNLRHTAARRLAYYVGFKFRHKLSFTLSQLSSFFTDNIPTDIARYGH
jgi:hypothetical protein